MIKKVSKIVAIGLMFATSTINSAFAITAISEEDRNIVSANLKDAIRNLSSVMDGKFQEQWSKLRFDSKAISGQVHIANASSLSTSGDYNLFFAINTNGTFDVVSGGASLSGLYYTFVDASDSKKGGAKMPAFLKDKSIALVIEHVSFEDPDAPLKVTSKNFQCYTSITSKDIAEFSGAATEDDKIDLSQFVKDEDNELPRDIIANCKAATFAQMDKIEEQKTMVLQPYSSSSKYFQITPL